LSTANSRINLKDGLESAIRQCLEEYSDEVIQVTEKVVQEVAKEAAQKLRKESPRSQSATQHRYSKGWTYTLDKKRYKTGATVYGKKGTYNLAHLLEFGHVLRSGGRQVGETRAIVHIKTVEEWAIKEFENRLKKNLNRG